MMIFGSYQSKNVQPSLFYTAKTKIRRKKKQRQALVNKRTRYTYAQLPKSSPKLSSVHEVIKKPFISTPNPGASISILKFANKVLWIQCCWFGAHFGYMVFPNCNHRGMRFAERYLKLLAVFYQISEKFFCWDSTESNKPAKKQTVMLMVSYNSGQRSTTHSIIAASHSLVFISMISTASHSIRSLTRE